MSDAGKYILEHYVANAKSAWAKIAGVTSEDEPFNEETLRRDMEDVWSAVLTLYEKSKANEGVRAFTKAASSETGLRGVAGTMLHKRHQLGRVGKVLAGLNNAIGLLDPEGNLSNIRGGLPNE